MLWFFEVTPEKSAYMPASRQATTIGDLPKPVSTFNGHEREIADVKQFHDRIAT
jgi:hypothetical protein